MTTGTSDRPKPVRASRRHEQADATRTLLLRTAERLYAEHGLSEVSNRQVAEAAGSANNSAVAYHVGTKADLIIAITDDHAGPIGRQMQDMVDASVGSSDLRDHVACLVRPYTDHLASLGAPSWFARFAAQTRTDPSQTHDAFFGTALAAPLHAAFAAADDATPRVPRQVAELRRQMVRVLVLHTCAEQERLAAASGEAPDWTLIGDTLIAGVTSVLLAQSTGSTPSRATSRPATAAARPTPRRRS